MNKLMNLKILILVTVLCVPSAFSMHKPKKRGQFKQDNFVNFEETKKQNLVEKHYSLISSIEDFAGWLDRNSIGARPGDWCKNFAFLAFMGTSLGITVGCLQLYNYLQSVYEF